MTLCSLEDKHEPDAALALARWEELQRLDPHENGAERRFRRRAFERARDRALQGLAMRLRPWMLGKGRPLESERSQARRRPRRRQRLVSGTRT